MKNNYPRLIPLWLLPLFLVVMYWLITCSTGCRTGGTWVNPKSAGTVIVPKSPEQLNKEAQAKREESEKFTQAQPEPLKPAKPQSARSTPKPTNTGNVEAEEANPTPLVPTAPTESFSPSVTTIDSTKVNVRPLPEKGDAIAIDLSGDVTESEGEKGQGGTTVNWLELWSFYLLCFLGLVILWMIYDVIKDAARMKKQGSPIKDHLENLKKPAKGTRKSRKKATKKKKASPRKKK